MTTKNQTKNPIMNKMIWNFFCFVLATTTKGKCFGVLGLSTSVTATTTLAGTSTTTTRESSLLIEEELSTLIKEQDQENSRNMLLCNAIDSNSHESRLRLCEIGTNQYGHRGLIATEDIQPNQEVLRIPRNCIKIQTTYDGTEQDDDDSWAGRLATQLMKQPLDGAYRQSLPSILPSVPTRGECWPLELLKEFQNPEFVNEIKETQEWKQLQLKKNCKEFPHSQQQQLEFYECLDLVCSRTIRTGNTFQLVPLLDMANHACQKQGGGYYKKNDDDNSISLYAGERGIRQGQEVTLDYGIRSSEDWLINYGFLPNRNTDGERIVLPKSRRIVTWKDVDDPSSNVADDDVLQQECSDLLAKMPTTLDEDFKLSRELLQHDKQRSDDNSSSSHQYQLGLAYNYRISRKILLQAVVAVASSNVGRSDNVGNAVVTASSFAYL